VRTGVSPSAWHWCRSWPRGVLLFGVVRGRLRRRGSLRIYRIRPRSLLSSALRASEGRPCRVPRHLASEIHTYLVPAGPVVLMRCPPFTVALVRARPNLAPLSSICLLRGDGTLQIGSRALTNLLLHQLKDSAIEDEDGFQFPAYIMHATAQPVTVEAHRIDAIIRENWLSSYEADVCKQDGERKVGEKFHTISCAGPIREDMILIIDRRLLRFRVRVRG
jgi:hypothetical protein